MTGIPGSPVNTLAWTLLAIYATGGSVLLALLSTSRNLRKNPWGLWVLLIGVPFLVLSLALPWALAGVVRWTPFNLSVAVAALYIACGLATFWKHKDIGVLSWWLSYAFVFGFAVDLFATQAESGTHTIEQQQLLRDDLGLFIVAYLGLVTGGVAIILTRIGLAVQRKREAWFSKFFYIFLYALPAMVYTVITAVRLR